MKTEVTQDFMFQNQTNLFALEILGTIEKYPMSKEKLNVEKYIKNTISEDKDIDDEKLKELLTILRNGTSISKERYLEISEYINKL